MKKLFTICLAIIFATQLTAQNSNKKNTKSLKEKIFSSQKHQRSYANMMQKAGYTEKLDSSVSFNYDGSDWIKTDFNSYKFDANGNVIETYEIYWYNAQEYKSRDSFSYSNNKLAEKFSFYYNNNNWTLSEKSDYTYNSDGNVEKINKSIWNPIDMDWELNSKDEYKYNANKNPIEFTTYYWDNNDWLADYREVLEYDGNNYKIKSTSYIWDLIADDWEANYKIDYTNNTDGHVTLSISQDWNSLLGIWVNESKQNFNYDANKNISTATFEYWNEITNQWDEEEKAVINYDLNVSYNDIAFPNEQFEGFNIVNKILNMETFEKDNNNWVSTYKENYHYSPFTTSGINKSNSVATNVYPNQAKDVVNFDLSQNTSASEIFIFDMNGKQVANYDVTGNNTSINIEQLSTGFYIYKIVGTDFISSGKLVKE